MTRKGPRKTVDASYWEQRLVQARAFREAARDAAVLAETAQNANPIVSQIVLSAIAYGDCLTAMRARVINRQDHAAAPKLLREVLREALPAEQEKRYRAILAEKDAAQYGVRATRLARAQRLLEELDEFARWAEDFLG